MTRTLMAFSGATGSTQLPSDLQGAARLAVEATVAVTDIVESMHHNISRVPWILGEVSKGRKQGIAGLVYRNIRTIAGWVGTGLDLAIEQVEPGLGGGSGRSQAREAWVAALNGVLGDYLAATSNPLAIPMEFRRDGRVLPDASAGGRILLLVHGLCMSDLQWRRAEHDHGAQLERDLGYRPVYLRYNSGLHVSTNGRELAERLEYWFSQASEPVTELAIVGFSLGGLVARSACYYASLAGHRWLRHLKRLVFMGTPHLGAPLERGGNWIDLTLNLSPYSAPLAALGKLRSAGITDLRHGNLLDEDWQGLDRFRPRHRMPQPVPLPAGVHCATLAATTGRSDGDLSDRLLGDGLVPVASALGRHPDAARRLSFEPEHQWVGYGMNHLGLLGRPEAYDALRQMLEVPLPSP